MRADSAAVQIYKNIPSSASCIDERMKSAAPAVAHFRPAADMYVNTPRRSSCFSTRARLRLASGRNGKS